LGYWINYSSDQEPNLLQTASAKAARWSAGTPIKKDSFFQMFQPILGGRKKDSIKQIFCDDGLSRFGKYHLGRRQHGEGRINKGQDTSFSQWTAPPLLTLDSVYG
jgi:hypothetical protein